MRSLITVFSLFTLLFSPTAALFGSKGRQNCQCRGASPSSTDYAATMSCCFGRDLGARPDATTACDLVDFPFPSPPADQQTCLSDLVGASISASEARGAVGFASEAFGMARLSSGMALRGPQCAAAGTGGCIHEQRFAACCANQGADGGYCWDE